MKKILYLFCIVMAAMMVLPESADAQIFGGRNKRRKKSSRKIGSFSGSSRSFNPEITYYAIGGGINALNYFGDIAPTPKYISTDVSFTRPGFNFFVKQKFGDRYSWRANFMWGRLKASDQEVNSGRNTFDRGNASRFMRNLDFRNDIYELTVTGQFDLFKHGGRFSSRPPLNIYLFLGAGVIYHNPKGLVPEYFSTDAYRVSNPNDFEGGNTPRYIKLDDAGKWVSLRDLGTEGQNFTAEQRELYAQDSVYGKSIPKPYSRVQIVLPIGIGARYKLTNNLDLGFEISYRHTFTDYLDDVSGNYVDLGFFGDPGNDQQAALAMAMSDKSNQLDQETHEVMKAFLGVRDINYTSEGSSLLYTRAAGYGAPGGPGVASNNRGDGGSQNDIYIVTNITLTYILGGGFVKGAKFR